MSELCYEIITEAPLAINERKPGGSQYQEGLNYIPGRLLRGALATEVLRHCQDPTHENNHNECPRPDLCRALFSETLLFWDSRPATANHQGPFLLPATATSCKDDSGFKPKKPKDWKDWDDAKRNEYKPKRHGVFDTLIDRACWEAFKPMAMQYAPRCPVCGGRTKAYLGSYSRSEVEEENQTSFLYHREAVSRELLTRVAINRRRGVAEDELLYAISALSQFVPNDQDDPSRKTKFSKTRYVGSIQLADGSLAPTVKTALERVHHLGSGSSRGLGRVRISVIDLPPKPAVADRLVQFNAMLAARWKIMSRWGGQEAEPAHQYFVVTLQSDAVLSVDDWWPDVRLSEAALWRACGETGQPPADLRLARCYTTPVTRSGFQAAWGLPKETDLAVQAGAVFLYEVGDLDGWAVRLQRLEDAGVGRRRAEGFGQVRACDPFHYEAVEEAK